MSKPTTAARARRVEMKRKRREARKVVRRTEHAARGADAGAATLSIEPIDWGVAGLRDMAGRRDQAGLRLMFLRRPVPCVAEGCSGTMTLVEGTEREPTVEELALHPWAAIWFERICGVCAFRSPSAQGRFEFD